MKKIIKSDVQDMNANEVKKTIIRWLIIALAGALIGFALTQDWDILRATFKEGWNDAAAN